jgi:hypothetical protein
LEVEPQFAFHRVRLLPEKRELPVSNGKIKFTLHEITLQKMILAASDYIKW